MLHQLGIKLGESLRNQAPSSVVLKQAERALDDTAGYVCAIL